MNDNKTVSWQSNASILFVAVFALVAVSCIIIILTVVGVDTLQEERKLQRSLLSAAMIVGFILIVGWRAVRTTLVKVGCILTAKPEKLLPGEQGVLLFLIVEMILIVALGLLLDWSNPQVYVFQLTATVAVAVITPIIQWILGRVSRNR